MHTPGVAAGIGIQQCSRGNTVLQMLKLAERSAPNRRRRSQVEAGPDDIDVDVEDGVSSLDERPTCWLAARLIQGPYDCT